MDWSDIQLFVAVAGSGSVRGAARELRLDASTVSRRLASLESGLGARLFERTKRGLVLTASGKLMLQSGERVHGELAELGRRIVGHDRRLGGVVRVTFPGSFTSLVHEAVATFVSRHRAIEVELLTLDALIDIDGRQADIAIRVADRPPEHLVGSRVAAMAGALYASREYLQHHKRPLEEDEHTWVDWDRRLASKPATPGWTSGFRGGGLRREVCRLPMFSKPCGPVPASARCRAWSGTPPPSSFASSMLRAKSGRACGF